MARMLTVRFMKCCWIFWLALTCAVAAATLRSEVLRIGSLTVATLQGRTQAIVLDVGSQELFLIARDDLDRLVRALEQGVGSQAGMWSVNRDPTGLVRLRLVFQTSRTVLELEDSQARQLAEILRHYRYVLRPQIP